jgi:hypothetical protein
MPPTVPPACALPKLVPPVGARIGVFVAVRACRSALIALVERGTPTEFGSNKVVPGRRAGQPLHSTTLRQRLNALDMPNLASRNRAIPELLLAAPAAIVASSLGYNPVAAARIAEQGGAGWARYAGTSTRPTRR